jgi:hypothetical protein
MQMPRIIVSVELTYLPVALVNEASVLVGWILRILQTLQQHLHIHTYTACNICSYLTLFGIGEGCLVPSLNEG